MEKNHKYHTDKIYVKLNHYTIESICADEIETINQTLSEQKQQIKASGPR